MREFRIDNDEKIDRVLNDYSDMIYKIAFSQTKDKYYAEEVFQEVFLRLVRKKPTFKSEEHLKAWLIRVTVNCSKSMFLSSYFKKRAVLDENMLNNIEDTSTDHRDRGEVYDIIMKLPKKYSSVLFLFYYEGYSIREISEILHKKESTIKTNLHRGRKQLEKNLKGVECFE